MTQRRSTVVALNYHRVVAAPEVAPRHLLHTVTSEVLRAQLDRCRQLGEITGLDRVARFEDLGELVFLLTFDDVPAVTLGTIEQLIQEGVPHTVSVCGSLAEAGQGWRDKVYAITRHASRARVLEAVTGLLGGFPEDPEEFSFYHFTKTAKLHPRRVIEGLVEPLFDELAPDVRESAGGRQYAGWSDIAELAQSPFVTIANHSWSHMSFEELSSAEREADILRAHTAIEGCTGRTPHCFTVPFGHVTQELLVDLSSIAGRLGYRVLLWTEGRATRVVEPYLGREIVNLLRIDVSPTLAGFEQQLRSSLLDPLEGPVSLLPRSSHREALKLESVSDQPRSGALESVLRPAKDYASSPQFYDYAFTSNPYRGERPDYVLASSRLGPEAIAYAFHSRFNVGRQRVSGIYVAGWRRMPRAGHLASTAVFRRLLEDEPVVGVYKPSSESAPALGGWTAVEVFVHTLELTNAQNLARASRSQRADREFEVERLSCYEESLDELASAMVAGRFTIAREPALYRWRLDAYPLARSSYVVLSEQRVPVAFAALLSTRDAAAVADFALSDPVWRRPLFEAAIAAAVETGARTLTVETSSKACSRELSCSFGASCVTFRNHYLLAGELLRGLPAEACKDGLWDERFVHETQMTGDVLLR
jgi:hypothetical protein